MEGMYRFPPHGERKRNNIFTAWNQCVSTRNKHLYNIYTDFFDFFFLFTFLSCSKEGMFVWKGFHCNKLYLTHFPVREGAKKKKEKKRSS